MYHSDSVNVPDANLWSSIHQDTCLPCYVRYPIYISLHRHKATPDERSLGTPPTEPSRDTCYFVWIRKPFIGVRYISGVTESNVS